MDTRIANPTTHAIITSGGGHHFITENTNKILTMANLDDLIETQSGTKVKVSAIMEILPIEEYYNQNPDRRPSPEAVNKFPTVDPADFRSPELSRNGLSSMIKGIERAIREFRAKGHEPLKALELLDKAQKAYKERYENSRIS